MLYGASHSIYIVLWIVIPAAKTITQKLEMKGPAEYEKWEQNVKNEFHEVKSVLIAQDIIIVFILK
jgi:phage shock protein C